MVHYELVKIIIDTPRLAEVIIDIVVQYHGFLDSIINNYGAVFTSKFWFLLCYFFDIKRQLSITFYIQTNG